MSVTRAFRSLLAATALLSACAPAPTEPAPTPIAPSAGAGGAGSPGLAGASGAGSPGLAGAGAGAGAGDAGGSAAGSAGSAGKNVPTAVTWSVIAESTESGIYASDAIAASRGEDAAVAYVEWPALTSSSRVVMQRFGSAAERIGAPIELESVQERTSNVTLASDGKQYAACWTIALEVHCALVDEQGQVQRSALVLAGRYATIVAGPSGWVIGYQTSDTQLRVQALTPALELSSSLLDLKLSPAFRQVSPLLSATASGFALIGAALDNGHDGLLRLDSALQPLAAAIPLGRDFWFYGRLAASDGRAAVSLSTAYGSHLLLLDADHVTAELTVAGGNKEGIEQALLVTEGGIGAAWLNADGALRRFFADGHDAEVGLGTHDAPDVPINTPNEGADSYQQLLWVGDRTLLIGRSARSGPLTSDMAIRAGALSFP